MTLEYRDSKETREAGITYHLAVKEEWESQKGGSTYAPAPFAEEGFVHCTDGLDLLTQIANMFYQPDTRERTVLVLDRSKVASEVRYDDDDELFPHIYGEINTDAVVAELPVEREADGTFIKLGAE